MRLGRALPLVVALLLFATLVAVSVAAAPEPSRALLRAAVGFVATLGYWEVLLHLTGYLPRVEPPVTVRLGLRLGTPAVYLKALASFTSGASAYRVAEVLANASGVLPLVAALLVAYVVKRVLDSAGRGVRGGVVLLVVAVATSVLALTALTDGDLKYIESIAKLVEEVVRRAV